LDTSTIKKIHPKRTTLIGKQTPAIKTTCKVGVNGSNFAQEIQATSNFKKSQYFTYVFLENNHMLQKTTGPNPKKSSHKHFRIELHLNP